MTDLIPHNLDAEQAVLGSILIDEYQINNINLSPTDFYDDLNRKVFGAMLNVNKKGKINQITVAHELEHRGKLEKAGGTAYLSHLISIVPTSLDCPYYAQIVKELSQQRKMIELSIKGDIDGVSRVLREAIRPIKLNTPREMADCMLGIIEGEVADSISWGFPELNAITGGCFSGDLVVVGARPSVGKTQIILQMGMRMARVGVPCLMVSLEMYKKELTVRMLEIETGINARLMVNKTLNETQANMVVSASADIDELDMHYLYGQSNVKDIRWALESLSNIRVVLIDYLTIMPECDDKSKGDNLTQRVGYITRNLKGIANEFSVTVIIASQLNRMSEHRENREPRLSDLRESGNIEQDADVAFLLHRESQWNANTKKENVLDIIMAKNRQLGVNRTEIKWDTEKRRYT